MRTMKVLLTGLLVLSFLAPPAEAQWRRRNRNGVGTALAAAAVLGVIGAIASNRNRNYYRPYGGYYGGYPGVYGYARPAYGYPAAGGLPFGATSFVDEGDYRNYRDVYGNYLGRVPLWQLGY